MAGLLPETGRGPKAPSVSPALAARAWPGDGAGARCRRAAAQLLASFSSCRMPLPELAAALRQAEPFALAEAQAEAAKDAASTGATTTTIGAGACATSALRNALVHGELMQAQAMGRQPFFRVLPLQSARNGWPATEEVRLNWAALMFWAGVSGPGAATTGATTSQEAAFPGGGSTNGAGGEAEASVVGGGAAAATSLPDDAGTAVLGASCGAHHTPADAASAALDASRPAVGPQAPPPASTPPAPPPPPPPPPQQQEPSDGAAPAHVSESAAQFACDAAAVIGGAVVKGGAHASNMPAAGGSQRGPEQEGHVDVYQPQLQLQAAVVSGQQEPQQHAPAEGAAPGAADTDHTPTPGPAAEQCARPTTSAAPALDPDAAPAAPPVHVVQAAATRVEPAVAAAVAAAFPGDSPLAVVRRCAAMLLAASPPDYLAPMTLLGVHLREHEPAALALAKGRNKPLCKLLPDAVPPAADAAGAAAGAASADGGGDKGPVVGGAAGAAGTPLLRFMCEGAPGGALALDMAALLYGYAPGGGAPQAAAAAPAAAAAFGEVVFGTFGDADDCAATEGGSASGRLAAAIAWAWPGHDFTSKLRRSAAAALADASQGPEGPHSMLWTLLLALLRKDLASDDPGVTKALSKGAALRKALDGAAATSSAGGPLMRIVGTAPLYAAVLDVPALLAAADSATRGQAPAAVAGVAATAAAAAAAAIGASAASAGAAASVASLSPPSLGQTTVSPATASATPPPAVDAAVSAAWPGYDLESVLRRTAARVLAGVADGPAGPHSLTWPELSKALYEQHPGALGRLKPFYGIPSYGAAIERAFDTATGAPLPGAPNGLQLLRVMRMESAHVYSLDLPALLRYAEAAAEGAQAHARTQGQQQQQHAQAGAQGHAPGVAAQQEHPAPAASSPTDASRDAEQLRALIDAAWPAATSGRMGQLLRVVAMWMADEGEHSVVLPRIAQQLHAHHRDLWRDPNMHWPKLKQVLAAPDALHVFVQETVGRREVVSMSVEALRRAASSAGTAPGGGAGRGMAAAGGSRAPGGLEREPAAAGCAERRGAGAAPVPAPAAAASAASAEAPAEAAPAASLVLAATAAAWPGMGALERLRRCAARLLARRPGQRMALTLVSDHLRKQEPAAMAELNIGYNKTPMRRVLPEAATDGPAPGTGGGGGDSGSARPPLLRYSGLVEGGEMQLDLPALLACFGRRGGAAATAAPAKPAPAAPGSQAGVASAPTSTVAAPEVQAAVEWAWPGDGPIPRLRRCAALALAELGAAAGPAGPNSMLWARAASFLRKQLPDAVKKLAVGGAAVNTRNTLRGALDGAAPAAALAAGLGGAPGAAASASAAAGSSAAPPVLHLVKAQYDHAVVLDLQALLAAYRGGAAAQQEASAPARAPAQRAAATSTATLPNLATASAAPPPAVDAAVAAAWPGDDLESVLRRTAARVLAGVADGPTGPHSLAWPALSKALRKEHSGALVQLKPLYGAPSFGAAIERAFGAAAGAPLPGAPNGLQLLRVQRVESAHVYSLDLPALLRYAGAAADAAQAHARTQGQQQQQAGTQAHAPGVAAPQHAELLRAAASGAAAASVHEPAAPPAPAEMQPPGHELQQQLQQPGQQQPVQRAAHVASDAAAAERSAADMVHARLPIPIPIPVSVPTPGPLGTAAAIPAVVPYAPPLHAVRPPVASVTAAEAPAGPPAAVATGAPAAASTAPQGAVVVALISDPYGAELATLAQHCAAVPRVGLAAQAVAGRPALVALFAPAAAVGAAPDGSSCVSGVPPTAPPYGAAVYLLDCAGAEAMYGGGSVGEVAVAALLAGVRGVLEAEGVDKLVYGSSQARCLEAACGTTVAGRLLDAQALVDGLSAMLGLPPASQLPPQLLATASGHSAAAEPVSLAVLQRQVTALRDALSATGLWHDRPDRLTTLARRHFAALKAALWAASGQDGAWLRRPLSAADVGAAAAAASELSGLWDALVGEALPWVAGCAGNQRLGALRGA